MSNIKRSPYYGALNQIMDDLFRDDEAPYMALIDEEDVYKRQVSIDAA